MSPAEDEVADVVVTGRSRESAVSAIVNADVTVNQVRARSAIEAVLDDGVVTRDGVEEELADVASVLSSVDTEAERTAAAFEEVRVVAEPVADVDLVRARLSTFAARLEELEEGIDDLDAERRSIAGRETGTEVTYGHVRAVYDLRRAVTDLRESMDELREEIDSFGTWLRDPDVRYDELAEDAGALEERVAEIRSDLDSIDEGVEPGARWAKAAIDHRVAGLLIQDLRSELVDVRTLAERQGSDEAERTGAIANRLDDVATRHDSVGERIESTAQPEWRRRYGDRLSAVEETLDRFDPPVEWGALQAALADVQGNPAGES